MRKIVILFFVNLLLCDLAPHLLADDPPLLPDVHVSENGSDDGNCGDSAAPCLTLDYALTRAKPPVASGSDKITLYITGVVSVESVVLIGGDYSLRCNDYDDDHTADVLTVAHAADAVVIDATDTSLTIEGIVLENAYTDGGGGDAVLSMSGEKAVLYLVYSTFRFSDASRRTTRVLIRITGGTASIDECVFTDFPKLLGAPLIVVTEDVRALSVRRSQFINICADLVPDKEMAGPVLNIRVGSANGTRIDIQSSNVSHTVSIGAGGAFNIVQMNSTNSSVCVNNTVFVNTSAVGGRGAIYYMVEDSDPALCTCLFTWLTFKDCLSEYHGHHIFFRGTNLTHLITPAKFFKSYLVTEDEEYLWGWTVVDGERVERSLLSFLRPLLLSDLYVSSANGSDVATCGAPAAPCLTLDYAVTKALPADTGAGAGAGTGEVVFYVGGNVSVSNAPLAAWSFSLQRFNTAVAGDDAPTADVLSVDVNAGLVVVDVTEAALTAAGIVLETPPTDGYGTVLALSGANATLELTNSTFRFTGTSEFLRRKLLSVNAGTTTITGCVFADFPTLLGVSLITVGDDVRLFRITDSNFTNIGAVDVIDSDAHGVVSVRVGAASGTLFDIQRTNFSHTSSLNGGGALFIDQMEGTVSKVCVNNSIFSNTTAGSSGGAIYYAIEDENPSPSPFLFSYLSFNNCQAAYRGHHIYVRGYAFPRIITPANFFESYVVTEDETYLWGWTVVEGEMQEGSLLEYLRKTEPQEKTQKPTLPVVVIIIVVAVIGVAVVVVVIVVVVVVVKKKKKPEVDYHPYSGQE